MKSVNRLLSVCLIATRCRLCTMSRSVLCRVHSHRENLWGGDGCSSEGFLDEQAMREQLPHHIDQPWDHVLQNEARLELIRAHFFKVCQQ